MITHSVFFNLKHSEGSVEEAAFFKKAAALRSIKSVRNFKCVREVSPKNEFKLGLVMEFEDEAGYSFYSEHPDHTAFVEAVWIPEVSDFIEIDYVDWSGI